MPIYIECGEKSDGAIPLTPNNACGRFLNPIAVGATLCLWPHKDGEIALYWDGSRPKTYGLGQYDRATVDATEAILRAFRAYLIERVVESASRMDLARAREIIPGKKVDFSGVTGEVIRTEGFYTLVWVPVINDDGKPAGHRTQIWAYTDRLNVIDPELYLLPESVVRETAELAVDHELPGLTYEAFIAIFA